MPKRIDMTGQTFGRYIVLRFVGQMHNYGAHWECRCSCGNIRVVAGQALRNGTTKSCGCLRQEEVSTYNYRHGHSPASHFSPTYATWANMIQRCTNQNRREWKNYGGRGITVCKRWQDSFKNFLEDMGKKPNVKLTIERINNNKGYSKGNCKWATRIENNNNRRPARPRRKHEA